MTDNPVRPEDVPHDVMAAAGAAAGADVIGRVAIGEMRVMLAAALTVARDQIAAAIERAAGVDFDPDELEDAEPGELELDDEQQYACQHAAIVRGWPARSL